MISAEVEDLWRSRLEEARQRYGMAALQCMKAQGEYRSQSLPSPDGDFKFRQAIRLENEARADYLRALRIFTRLVLYGEAPPEQ